MATVARQIGHELMPWQAMVADVGLELLPDGRPAYRAVRFSVPRQSGKTVLILAWEIQRALGWDGPQRIAYSAQTGNDARKKLIEDQVPLLERHRRRLGVKRILKGMGNEAVEWLNGSRLVLLASSSDSGHGKTVDLGVKDELFADADFRRDQALVPAMATKAYAQVLTASTMGTASSLALNEEVAQGRKAVDDGLREGIAYFEWSAPPDSDPDDEDVWRSCMPAVGHTIDLSVVRHARRTLDNAEFMRAFMNIPTGSIEGPVWAPAVWEAVVGAYVPAGPLSVGVDASPGQQRASIAVAAGGIVELVDNRPQATWLVPRLLEMRQRNADLRSAPVALDPAGPAGFILPELESAGVTVAKVSGLAMGQACAQFSSAVTEGKVRVRRHAALDAAVAGARTQPKGDVWIWSRKDGTVDVSPLVAITLALWTSGQPAEAAKPTYAY